MQVIMTQGQSFVENTDAGRIDGSAVLHQRFIGVGNPPQQIEEETKGED